MVVDQPVRMDVSGRRIAIVVSRFNELATARLVDGTLDCLVRHGAGTEDITVYRVAGAFELPQVASYIARRRAADGIVCLGAIIRGETLHYDVLSRAVVTAIERVAIDSGIPVTLGVLTVDSLEQALDRSGGKHGNAGTKAASSLVELLGLWRDE